MRAVNAVNYCSPILHSLGNLSSRIPFKIACPKPFFVDGIYSTDNNTTYSLSKSGSTITLTGSDGSTASVTDSDTVYTHPTYTSKSAGLYKITVDGTGHVSTATAVTKSDITALGIPEGDTDTHYTSKNVVGSSTATSNTITALTNGNVYLNSVENGEVTSTHKISGSGATTVTTDASGNIIVGSTNTVTTVSTTGSGNAVTGITESNGALTVTKGSTFLTAHPTISKSSDTTSTASPAHGGTFTAIDSITRDSNGHVTKINTKTITLPGDTNTDTKNTAGSTNTSSKIYLIGATSQATNPQTYSHDTAYVDTDGCLYSGGNRVATEIISTSEPSGQTTGDFWMLAY